MNENTMNDIDAILHGAIAAAVDDSALAMLDGQRDALRECAADPLVIAEQLALIMPRVARRVSGQGFQCELPLDTAGQVYPLRSWTVSDAARVLLVQSAMRFHAARVDPLAILRAALRFGDDDERASLLKACYWLDRRGELVDRVVDAERTNAVSVFAAIAQHNPYPARWYSEAQFNQLVIKALFVGVSIEFVDGLRARRNRDLSRICADFIDERVAAGRPVPASLWLALRLEDLGPGTLDAFTGHLGDNDPRQRYFVALSLTWQAPAPLPDVLEHAIGAQAARETERAVAALLAQVLEN